MSFWRTLPKPFTVLAPMEDVTDAAFRQLVLRHGRPTVFFTEFTSVEGLISKGREAVIHRLRFSPEEKPIVAQIWGVTPEKYRSAAQLVAELGFDGVDINMGCPVSKIVKNGACSGLIENPSLAAEIIAATREGAGSLAVSVKTRLGFRDWRTEEWAGFLLEQNLDALTIHGRIAKQMSEKPAKWDEIGRVVTLRNQMNSNTVIIGNGDVHSMKDVREKADQYGVDGAMIGRGIFPDLFVFRDDGPRLRELSPSEKIRILIEHVEIYRQTWESDSLHGPIKKFFRNYLADFPGASELRVKTMECETISQVISMFRHYVMKENDQEPDSPSLQ